MNAAYALLMEEARKVNPSLLDTLETVAEWKEGGSREPEPTAGGSEVVERRPPAPPPRSEESIARQNDQALAAVQAAMSRIGIGMSN